ncbi:MAG: hypothetical protein HRU20_25740 [Pseudomonadales bacterium]|nr:hypothetical protein [Pseudomonadales bacterium]
MNSDEEKEYLYEYSVENLICLFQVVSGLCADLSAIIGDDISLNKLNKMSGLIENNVNRTALEKEGINIKLMASYWKAVIDYTRLFDESLFNNLIEEIGDAASDMADLVADIQEMADIPSPCNFGYR